MRVFVLAAALLLAATAARAQPANTDHALLHQLAAQVSAERQHAVIERLGARPEEVFFWATHAGAELDLLVVRGRKRIGFEFKLTAAPRMTPSIHTALDDLRLDRVDVVYPGEHTFPMAEKVRALALSRLLEDLERLE